MPDTEEKAPALRKPAALAFAKVFKLNGLFW
jgi:hypothetical protein